MKWRVTNAIGAVSTVCAVRRGQAKKSTADCPYDWFDWLLRAFALATWRKLSLDCHWFLSVCVLFELCPTISHTLSILKLKNTVRYVNRSITSAQEGAANWYSFVWDLKWHKNVSWTFSKLDLFLRKIHLFCTCKIFSFLFKKFQSDCSATMLCSGRRWSSLSLLQTIFKRVNQPFTSLYPFGHHLSVLWAESALPVRPTLTLNDLGGVINFS